MNIPRWIVVVALVCVVCGGVILPVELSSAFQKKRPMRWAKLPDGLYECLSVEENQKARIGLIFFNGEVRRVILEKNIPTSRFLRVSRGFYCCVLESVPVGQGSPLPTTLLNQ